MEGKMKGKKDITHSTRLARRAGHAGDLRALAGDVGDTAGAEAALFSGQGCDSAPVLRWLRRTFFFTVRERRTGKSKE
jgi:hypothetical protein